MAKADQVHEFLVQDVPAIGHGENQLPILAAGIEKNPGPVGDQPKFQSVPDSKNSAGQNNAVCGVARDISQFVVRR